MRIGKLGLTFGQSIYIKNPLLKIKHIHYVGGSREFIIGIKGYFLNISWMQNIYKLSTDI